MPTYSNTKGRIMTVQPIRVNLKTACQCLAVSREFIRKAIMTDPTFPKPYKTGTTKQASVYFDYADLMEWHKAQQECHQDIECF